MRSLLFSTGLALFTLMSDSLAAEDNKPVPENLKAEAGQMVDRRIEMMRDRLKLTPEQTEKIRVIMLGDQVKFLQMRDDSTLTDEERNKRAGEIIQRSREELQAVLTSEQKEIWKAEAEKQRKPAK